MERARNMLGSPQMVGVPIVVTSARLMVTEPTCTTGWSSAGSDLSLSDSDVSMPTQMVRRSSARKSALTGEASGAAVVADAERLAGVDALPRSWCILKIGRALVRAFWRRARISVRPVATWPFSASMTSLYPMASRGSLPRDVILGVARDHPGAQGLARDPQELSGS